MMNLEVGFRVKVMLLFMISLFSAATVAHSSNVAHGLGGLGTSGNGDGTINCPDGKSE